MDVDSLQDIQQELQEELQEELRLPFDTWTWLQSPWFLAKERVFSCLEQVTIMNIGGYMYIRLENIRFADVF